ncbi:MAG: hypothetical protein Q4F11_09840 [Eubacteriales bacterium]|nr:hypothetical protein [Eubacteriales bacterium]
MASGSVIHKKNEYVVGGYTFHSKENAQAAKDELNAIKYVSAKTNGNDPKQVYILYNKLIDRKLFETPLGLAYLKELQQFLYISDMIPNEKIRPIPIKNETHFAIEQKRERIEHRSELHELSIQVARYKNNYMKLLIVNVVLFIAVIIMFLMLRTSSNPNIVNYEVNIQDKYAQWQEQLESQEESIKARQDELNQKK